jgi:hypothetical protein
MNSLRDEQSLAPRPLFIPRGLVVLTALWIFLSWVSLFGFQPPVQAQSASYGPSIRLLFVGIGVGISIAWPLLRLSGRRSSAPIAQCVFDALAIFVLLQVVIWPLRLVTSWSLPRALALDAAICFAVCSTGALLSIGVSAKSERTRAVMMSGFVLLTLAPAAVFLLTQLLAGGSPSMMPALLALSTPALLSQFSAPVPLDPGSEEVWLLKVAAIGAGISLVAAIGRHFLTRFFGVPASNSPRG